MIWVGRAFTALMCLGSLIMAGFAAFHFHSIGFTVTMLTMAGISGYMVSYDVRRILADRAKK